MLPKLRTTVDVVLVLCALVVTGAVVRNGLARPGPRTITSARDSSEVRDWRGIAATGIWDGPADAKLVIVEFADFECPFCKRYDSTLKAIRAEFPDKVAVVYKPWPLESHRFAMIAARYAECAHRQGRFNKMSSTLYANQDAFGIRPWTEFPHDADIPDVPEFETCARSTKPIRDVDESVAAVRRIGATGTPSLIVNGWLMKGPIPQIEELRARARAVSGRSE